MTRKRTSQNSLCLLCGAAANFLSDRTVRCDVMFDCVVAAPFFFEIILTPYSNHGGKQKFRSKPVGAKYCKRVFEGRQARRNGRLSNFRRPNDVITASLRHP